VRKGAPLLLLIGGLLIALIVLPSALNLPQTNPSTTLEYAPVPPEDTDVPPPVGNFDQFGLGQSSSIDTGGAQGGDQGTLQADKGKNTSTKRCVQTAKGPKQTEDPLAPPCVPDYPNCNQNGGATYQGVTNNEIRLLLYEDSGIVDLNTSRGDESRPANKYYDLDSPEAQDEHIYARLTRGWQKYFEDRYQLYCRHAHFWVYYGSRSDDGPETKRADAADNYQKIQPFAVISDSLSSNDAYLEAMTKRGVLNFGAFLGRERSFYQQYPKLVWGYSPTLEDNATEYVDFFCKQVHYNQGNETTTFAGGNLAGKKRRYGLVYSTDKLHPELQKLKDLVMDGIKSRCPISQPGGIPSATWDECCYGDNNDPQADQTYGINGMAKFSDANQAGGPVTTIIWPGGIESKFSDAAANDNYFPEWVVLGDATTDGYVGTQFQNQQVWGGHAWVVSYQTKKLKYEEEPCFLAYKDADPNASDQDIRSRACDLYDRFRQLFTGIQVAGPKLGPTSIDKGYHAIPKIASEDSGTPACFYNTDDYSCVKDGIAMWWDSNATAPNSSNAGCWKVIQNAKRYLYGTFPTQEIQTMKSPNDVCNGYGGHTLTFLSPRP
jgi:hypothetical protein